MNLTILELLHCLSMISLYISICISKYIRYIDVLGISGIIQFNLHNLAFIDKKTEGQLGDCYLNPQPKSV